MVNISQMKLLRIKLGLSQQQAADALKISRSYVSQIESLKVKIDHELKDKFAKLYRCSISDLGLH